MEQKNAPARRGEGVMCLLPGDNDAHTTIEARVQFLNRLGITPNRAATIASLCFGEIA